MDEDTQKKTNAGKYLSIIGVDPRNTKKLINNMKKNAKFLRVNAYIVAPYTQRKILKNILSHTSKENCGQWGKDLEFCHLIKKDISEKFDCYKLIN